MPAEVKQDILYNVITNVASFMEGADRMINAMGGMERGMQSVAKNTSFLNLTLSNFAANLMTKVLDAVNTFFGTLKRGFGAFVDYAKQATMTAARIEVQWRTLSLTAGNAGQNIEDMTKHIQALRAAGIKTGEAIEILTQFLANELPVENITELARRAQDMAVVIGKDSTEAFRRFNYFLQTGNSEWIRTMGITKTANQMLQEYARTQGKVVSALTDRERKEALIQGLMKETMRYEGAYEEAMKDPYKRWTSLPRLISNVTEVLGAVFVPMMGTIVDVMSDALEKIERLFRVTKKEAKETGQTIGEWKEGFLKLRAVVTAFANWFMSLWKRLTGGFNEATESMMDRFVNAIIRGVQAAADALSRFARFVAGIFGGRAPAAVPAAEAVARIRPEVTPEKARAAPPLAEPYEVPLGKPGEAEKLRAKPVTPPAAEDIARFNTLMEKMAALQMKVAKATQAAAKARNILAKAEEVLERASEKVYDIRRKIQRLELDWAEIPERFIRGRKRQLQLELQAAEHEEHERQKEKDAADERFREAEKFARTVEQNLSKMRSEWEKLGNEIKRQSEKYDEWLAKLKEAEAVRIVEPVQAIVNEFESLDDLTAGYLEEIEGQLYPAFVSIEESVKSIIGSLGEGFEKAKEFFERVKEFLAGLWEKLQNIRQWFDGLPDWVKKILMGGAIALGISWLTGAGGLGGLVAGLTKALISVGLALGPAGWAMTIAASISLSPLLSPEFREDIKKFKEEVDSALAGEEADVLGAAAQVSAQYLHKHPFVGPIFDKMLDFIKTEGPTIEETLNESWVGPILRQFNLLDEELVGASIIPEMVREIVGWFEQMTLDLTPWLDQLTGKFNVLSRAIEGLPPLPKDLLKFDSGMIKITNIDLSGSTFGSDLTEREVKDWMYEAIEDVV